MSWDSLPEPIRQIARTHLAPGQLEAWQHELAGLRPRRIALELDLSRAAVIDRLDGAYRNLRRHGVYQDASGNWYLDRKDAA